MAIFDFKCPQCNTVIAKMIRGDQPVHCPHDNALMDKQFSAPAFKFSNGHGTYLGNLMSIPNHPISSSD